MAVLYAAKLLLNLPHPWPDCLSEAEAPKKETEQSQNGEITPGVRLLSFFPFITPKDFEVDADRRLNFRRAIVTFIPRLCDEISKKVKPL